MPIEAPSGTLDIENAKLRVSEFSATTGVGIGTENTQNYPLYIYKASEPELILQEGTVAAAKFTSSNGSLFIQSGITLSDNSDGDIVFSDMGVNTRHVTIKGTTGNVGIGTSPGAKLDVFSSSTDPGAVPTLHVGDGAIDYGDYGMLQLTRHPTDGGSKAHAAFIRSGNSVFGMGFHNNTNTFGFWPSFSTVTNTPTMSFTSGGNVGIGTASPDDVFETYDSVGRIKITRSANTNNFGCALDFALLNSANAKKTYARIGGSITDNTSGSEDGFLSFQIMTNGALGDGYEQDKMRITSDGNVGIGTVSPGARLEVHGDSTNTWGNIITLKNSAGSYRLNLKDEQANPYIPPGLWTGSGGGLSIGSQYEGIMFYTSASGATPVERMRILQNGNIGIGTANPLSLLTIKTNYSGGESSGLCLDSYDGSVYNFRLYSFVQSAGNVGWKFRVNNGASSVDALTLGSTGNVGIGTNVPSASARLDVDGTLLCGVPNTHRYSSSIARHITRWVSDVNQTGLSEIVRLSSAQQSGIVKIHYQAGAANTNGALQHSCYAVYGFSWGGGTNFYTHEHTKTQKTTTTISFSVDSSGNVTVSVSTGGEYGSYCSLYTEWFYGATGGAGLYVNV
jgi:hypothetical protein